MPTLPSAQAGPSPIEPHKARQIAESFGTDPERYDRTRPRYPDALVERIVAASPGPGIVDVGCGTGTAARQFQAAGCTVLGVEPDARMAGFARRSGVDVEVATFETWGSAGRVFDTVIAATAWHWVDPVAGAAKAAQVLRPGGRLAVFGHVFQPPPAIVDALARVYHRVVPDSPFDLRQQSNALDGYQRLYAGFGDRIGELDEFTDVDQWRIAWEQPYTRDEWLDQVPTHGSLTRLPPDKLAEILEDVGTAIDAMGGAFTMPYATVLVSATRTGPLGTTGTRMPVTDRRP